MVRHKQAGTRAGNHQTQTHTHARARAGGCVWPVHSGAVPGGSLAGCLPACCCFLVPVFARFVRTRSLRLTLLLFCSVFRVLGVCCCASSCAAGGDDSPRSCHKCFCACSLVDVTNTHTINASPPTQANNDTRATNGNFPARPQHMHLTNTSHRTLCHRGTSHTHSGTAPTAGATGTRATHIQLKPRRRGKPTAPPVMEPRHSSASALGLNKQNGRNLRRSKSRTQSHTHAHTNPPEEASPSAAGTPRSVHTGPGEWGKVGAKGCGRM